MTSSGSPSTRGAPTLSVQRRDGRLIIDIAEARVLALATDLYAGRATVTHRSRLLEHVATSLAAAGRSGRGAAESPLDRLLGDILAEAAHARAGMEWTDPAQHTLIHQ